MGGAAGGGYGGGYGGFSGGGFSMDDIFEQFGDIFGGAFGGGGRSRSRTNRGSDIRVTVKLSLQEIAEGVTKKLKINKTVTCDKCGGSGAKDASSIVTCPECNGSGYIVTVQNSFFGRMQTQSICPTCGGSGRSIKDKCSKCGGEGTERGQEVIEVKIPAGVAEGMAITVRGKGNAARRGGTSGDLLVVIEEEQHPEFVRDGNDLIHNLNITVTRALLGGEVEIPTIDGKARIKIAPGTHAGKVLRIRGKGLPDVNGRGRGDIKVMVDITIPGELTTKERELVEKLAEQPNFKDPEKLENQNILERMKSFFRG
jgi:molecular chaperone DnaJ